MKFVKVMNSTRITKGITTLVILILFSNLTLAQQIPGNIPFPQGVPTGMPTNFPPQQGNGTQRNQVPTDENVREVDFTELDDEMLTHEDSVRLAIEQEESEDLALTALRRRIFGYKLFNQATFNPNFSINIATPNNYVLGPNDQLIIDVFGYAEDHNEVLVNADGNILLPRSGLIQVGGLDILAAKEKIFNKLSKRFIGLGNSTKLSVTLGNVRSIKVNVIGEAVAPGSYTMTSFASILNALYACGGPNEIGSFRTINLIRNNKITATLDLYDIITKGSSSQNFLLKDQDVIQIPPLLSRVAVNGYTNREGFFEVKSDESLKDLIDFAGGFDKDAYKHRIKVYRNTNRDRQILDVLGPDFETTMLSTGDSVVIEKVLDRFQNMVTIEGAIFREGEYSLDANPTLMTLISSAEGLREDALIGRISIIRTNDDLSLENFSVNLRDLKSGIASDFELRREDQIIIPSVFDLTEAATIRISGAINNPDAIEGVELDYIKNMTLEDVLVRVGGLTEAASLTRVEIVRRKRNVDPSLSNAQISDIITVDMTPDYNVLKGQTNPVLMPFDEITVRSSPNYQEQTFVELQGEVLYTGVYGIGTKEERISDIIKRAGGLKLQAYTEGATLIRTVVLSDLELELKQRALNEISNSTIGNQIVEVEEVEPTQQQSIDIDLTKIMRNPGSFDDLIVRDGDIIRIPTLLETIRIQGEVLYPNTVKYKKVNTFKDYISGAGGFTKTSLKKRSYVVYANGSVDRTRKFLFFNIYPKVKPGSEIIVPQKGENSEQQLARVSNVLTTLSATLGTLVTIYGFLQIANN